MSKYFNPFTKITSKWIIFSLEQLLVLLSFVCSFVISASLSRTLNVHDTSFGLLILINAVITTAGMLLFKTHTGIIRYSELRDVYTILKFSVFQFICWLSLHQMISDLITPLENAPYIMVINLLLVSLFMIGFRLLVKEIYARYFKESKSINNVLVYGAGAKGLASKKSIELDGKNGTSVIAFIDDDVKRIGKTLNGLNIVTGQIDSLRKLINRFQIKEVIIAADITPEKKSELATLCSELSVKLSTVPPLSSWTNGSFKPRQVKELTIESLLEREVIQVLNERSQKEFEKTTVLVTGAAGSIGSEICRQLSKYNLTRLVLLDQSETGLHDIVHELTEQNESIDFCMELASIRDADRINTIMRNYKPQFVFHAAAYKHVPILEYFPYEVVSTNVRGTKIIADAAFKYGVKKFVMISTDKAVNPTNIMGATKRIAEMYVQAMNNQGGTQFITTRFGNVLGSNGSVVPLFKRQIEKGGPITVTHPDITRYFMTIPEASNLVLEAGIMGNGGEIFVFDMGKPVKIIDLAKKMIELSGMRYGKDINIVFQGLRPGEKMFEELFKDSENLVATHHPKILKALKCDIPVDFIKNYDELLGLAHTQQVASLRNQIKSIVPEYNYDRQDHVVSNVRLIKSKESVKKTNEEFQKNISLTNQN
jgi:FlaA1/EpsC-like NDP-sugar epimerase